MKNKIVIIYQYFFPGYMAGGPIQSISNLIPILQPEHEIKVITSAFDLKSLVPYPEVEVDRWSWVNLPPISNKKINVWYNSSPHIGILKLFQLIRQSEANIVYVNGLFTSWSTFTLILKRLGFLRSTQLVLSPRGMLQKGALNVKPLKKKLYLSFLKIFWIVSKVRWHATDEQEKKDIQRIFGLNQDIKVASNIPKPLITSRKELKKKPGELRLVFLSLITEKKNLHLVLGALSDIKTPVTFDIYGPIKDELYWKSCEQLINDQIHDIKYLGTVDSTDVQSKFSEYHVMILPTKGENFGHAIYESLSTGTPVIVSQFTPWGQLQNVSAGITVSTFEIEDWVKAIQNFILLSQEDYNLLSYGARKVAEDYLLKNDFKSQYEGLFL